MRKILFILLLAPFALKSQTVNTFRDSTWFKRGVRFDSTLVFSKGAGVGKVWTSNANGTGSWQTFSSAGVTQGALDDSISAVRAIRKIDTIYKSLDSIVFKINGLRYSIKDSTGTVDATVSSYGKNTGKDSTILVLSDGTRYSAKDSIANLTGYALQVSLNDTANALRGLIPNVSSYATITNLADTSSLLRGLINTKGTGTVTSVATDATLTGGTITTSGTLKVDTSVISTKANVTGLLLGKSNISDTANQNLGIRTDYINRLTTKQDNLISGTSIKTINSTSLLGSGNILTPDAQTLSAGTNTLTISGGNTVNLNRKVDTSYIGLNATRDSLIFNNTINGTAYRYAVRDSTGGGSGSALSSITAATATNTINNVANTQEWQWNSLSASTGLKLSSSSTANTSGSVLLDLTMTGATATYQNNTVLRIANNKTNANLTNKGIDMDVTSGIGINMAVGASGTGINLAAGMSTGIQLNANKLSFDGSNTGTIQYTGGVLQVRSGSSQTFNINTGTSNYWAFCSSIASNYLTINRIANGSYALVFGGDYLGSSYRSELTSSNVIKASSGTLTFCGNTGSAGGFMGITPTDIMSVYGTNSNVGIGTTTPVASASLEISSTTKGFLPPRMTATQASAIASPAKSLMLYVTDTNGTFTSAGLWIYTTSWKLIIAE